MKTSYLGSEPNWPILRVTYWVATIFGIAAAMGVRDLWLHWDQLDPTFLVVTIIVAYLSVLFFLVARFYRVLPQWATWLVPRFLYDDYQKNYVFRATDATKKNANVKRLFFAAIPGFLAAAGYFSFGWEAGLLGLVLGAIIYKFLSKPD